MTAGVLDKVRMEVRVAHSDEATAHTIDAVNAEYLQGAARTAGESLWQPVEEGDKLCAVLVWCACAFRLEVRDSWIGWDDVTRAQCLKLIVQKRRLFIMEAARWPNPAVQIMGATLRALPAQWEQAHGHAPLLAEPWDEVASRQAAPPGHMMLSCLTWSPSHANKPTRHVNPPKNRNWSLSLYYTSSIHVGCPKFHFSKNNHAGRGKPLDAFDRLGIFGDCRIMERFLEAFLNCEENFMGNRDYLLANHWSLAVFAPMYMYSRVGSRAPNGLPLQVKEEASSPSQRRKLLRQSTPLKTDYSSL